MPSLELYFEDLYPGRIFELGPKTVQADEITAFAAEFDPQPMHLDEEAGKKSLLGGLAASGWHTSSLFMRMMIDSYLLRSASEGSPGIDVMEWKRPVLAGDTLSGRSVVEAARPTALAAPLSASSHSGMNSRTRGRNRCCCRRIRSCSACGPWKETTA